MSLVAAENLSIRYGARTALSHVSLRIERGEIVTIVGPNGSGKTSLLRAIIGAVRPAAGRVTHAPGLRIGYVPQKLHIDPTLPITVARFLRLRGRPDQDAIRQALRQAGVPDLSGRQMSKLSGGQFQRVLLASALINQPDLLLLDEATQGLDQPGSAAFYRQIEEVRRRYQLRRPDDQSRAACGDERVRPGHLPQRPCLLRRGARYRRLRARIPRPFRHRHEGGAGALPA